MQEWADKDGPAAGREAMDRIRFSAVVVTHDSADVVRPLLESLPKTVEIICVDNASSDGTQQGILPRPGAFIRNGRNLGYGAACNRGAIEAEGDFLVFLNPDVRISGNLFHQLRAAIVRYPDAVAFTPRILDEEGRVQNRDYNFVQRSRATEWHRRTCDFSGDCCVHFLHGGLFAIKRTAFEELGGFDKRIFLYYEDDDLAFRLAGKGMPIVYLHEAHASHGTQASAPRSLRRVMWMNFHKKRSEIYVRSKYALPYWRVLDGVDLALRIAFYGVTFRMRRMFAAMGRLRGVLGPARS